MWKGGECLLLHRPPSVGDLDLTVKVFRLDSLACELQRSGSNFFRRNKEKTLKMPWRGLNVLASWILWPPLFVVGYWLANIFLATGRRCSIEGCDPPDGVLGFLWLAAAIGPPLFLTYQWLRRRLGQRSSAD